MTTKFDKNLGEKLEAVREMLKLSKKEVASKMGFESYQILSNIEDGTRKVQAHELALFAKIYLQDINYFLSDEADLGSKLCVLWRDYNSCNEQSVRLKESEFLKYCRNYYELEKVLGVSHKNRLPAEDLAKEDFCDERIREIANKYYHLMQLGARPGCSLAKVLEEKYNIKILYLDLADAGSGASAVDEFGAAILLNCANAPWRRNFDLAHELFHIITWGKFPHEAIHSTTGEKPLVEKWADRFASELLLPADELLAEFDKRKESGKIALIDIIGLAREFMVSTQALLWRLVNLKQIDGKIVEKLEKDMEFRKLDHDLRVGDLHRPNPLSARYVNLALKAYQKGVMSKGKLAEYLATDRMGIKQVLAQFGYAEQGAADVELAVA
ncbi:MAG: ImmA/IrrE family metallo-endopeptidase [Candidatus Omnitrophica bacterium]|nr:ImmA/IrrE family metallo-endopeptidase [Candidatus Omnitrophota bacterium]